jgi:diguanylate cyclase (GGDEF)-like protein/PAS domain S-box-containing protein
MAANGEHDLTPEDQARLFRTVIELMPLGVSLFDADLRLVYFNERFADLGVVAGTLRLGMSMRENFAAAAKQFSATPDEVERAWQARLALMEKKQPYSLAYHLEGRSIVAHARPAPDGGWCVVYEDATSLITTERQLRDQSERTQRAIDHMPCGLTMYDAQEQLVLMNEKFLEFYDHDPNVIKPGASVADIAESWARSGNDFGMPLEKYVEQQRQHIAAGTRKQIRVGLVNGRAIEVTSRAIAGGGWVSVHEDVTEQLRNEEAVREQNVRFDAALGNIKQGICMFDAEKKITVVTDRFLSIFRADPALLQTGTHIRALCEWGIEIGAVDPDRFERLYASWLTALDRREPFSFDQSFDDGRVLACEISPMDNGGWICTVEDVTEGRQLEVERRAALNALKEQNFRFDGALNSMMQGLAMFDADHRLIVCNAKFREMFRFTPEEAAPGISLESMIMHGIAIGLYSEANLDELMRPRQSRVAAGQAARYDRLFADGTIVEVVVDPMPDGKWISTFEDVTARRAADAARAAVTEDLREQNFRFDAALNNMSQGLAMFDADSRLMVCNEKYIRIFGMDEQFVRPGVHLMDLFQHRIDCGAYPGRKSEQLMRRHQTIRRGRKPVTYDETVFGRVIECAISPMANGGSIAVFEDQTESRRAAAERRAAIQGLQEQNLRFDAALNNMSQGLCMFDGQQRLIVCNARYLDILGVDPAIVKPGVHLRDLFAYYIALGHFPGETLDELLAKRLAIVAAGAPVTFEHAYAGGRLMQTSITPMTSGGWVATIDDVTESRKLAMERAAALKDLSISNTRFNAALESMPSGLSMLDRDLKVQVANRRFVEMFGLNPENLLGRHIGDVIREIVRNGTYGAIDPEEAVGRFVNSLGETRTFTFHRHLADGRILKGDNRPTIDGGWITTFEDITDSFRAQQRATYMARHDALTWLPNRAMFLEKLNEGLDRVRTGAESMAILCLDLDDFKSVNDTLGHPIGDHLLTIVARRLGQLAEEGMTIARFGGDEFAILQFGDQPLAAIALAETVVRALARPVLIDGHEIETSVSIGIAMAPIDGQNGDVLMKCADLALYRAKAEGRGQYALFEPEMNERLIERRALERDLRRAVVGLDFELHYQPQVRVSDGELVGMEALLRWNHAQRGFIPPSEFIPVAEETGLIVPLGEWVLQEACKAATQWPAHVRLSVNLSAAQFSRRHGLLAMVTRALGDAGLSPSRLELEITEAVLLREESRVFEILHGLRTLGVCISMDDFGTGYSSLSYLHRFPFDRIKIDRSFICDLDTRKDSAAIVRAIVSLGQNLDIAVTAEGVETAEQVEQLRALGCAEAQGYFFGRPMPLGDTLDDLLRRAKRVA